MEENQMQNDELAMGMDMDMTMDMTTAMEEKAEMDTMDEAKMMMANPGETKNEKFMRLAEYRVNKLMTAIASLDKLHNRSSYDYSEEQVNMMFSTIEEQLAQAKSHFQAGKVKEAKFSFNLMK